MNNSIGRFKKIAGSMAALCVVYMFTFIFSLAYYSYAEVLALNTTTAISLFNSLGGLGVVLMLALIIVIYTASKKKQGIVKGLFWAILLVTAANSLPFFSNIANFIMADFFTVVQFSQMYISTLMLCAVLIALINEWHLPNKRITKKIAFVGIIISLISIVIFFADSKKYVPETNLGDIMLNATYLIYYVLIALICLAVHFIAKSEANFTAIITQKIEEGNKNETKLSKEATQETRENKEEKGENV